MMKIAGCDEEFEASAERRSLKLVEEDAWGGVGVALATARLLSANLRSSGILRVDGSIRVAVKR